jgi:hypothetical protein
LSGKGNGLGVVSGPKVGSVESIVIRNEFLDHIQVEDSVPAREQVAENLLSEL